MQKKTRGEGGLKPGLRLVHGHYKACTERVDPVSIQCTERVQGLYKATTRLPSGYQRACTERPHGVPKAYQRLPYVYPKATLRLPQGVLIAWGLRGESVGEARSKPGDLEELPCAGLVLWAWAAPECRRGSAALY